MKKIVQLIMLISLIIVFISGLLLKPMPSMVLGIIHGLSGFVLVISVIIHIKQIIFSQKNKLKEKRI